MVTRYPNRSNGNILVSSSPREPPPQALSEPCVKLSLHTALLLSLISQGSESSAVPPRHLFPSILLTGANQIKGGHPFAPSGFPRLSTLLRVTPPLTWRIDTFALAGPPLETFLFTSPGEVPALNTPASHELQPPISRQSPQAADHQV